MIVLFALLSACFEVDPLFHNPVNCADIGPATCEDKDDPWGKLCTPCDEPYDFGLDYAWTEATLGGLSVRPIDGSTVQQSRFTTDDGLAELDAFFIPAHGDDPDLARITVIYNHGNYASLEHYLPRIRLLHELGFSVYAWDYRQYGKSDAVGAPSGEQFIADSRTALLQAKALAEAQTAGPLLIYGYSLGGIPAVEMALQDQACGLILETPFTSVKAAGISNSAVGMPGGFIASGLYENVDKISGYEGPLLLMAGDADTVFTEQDLVALYDNAPGPKQLWILPGIGHGIGGSGGVPEAGLGAYFDTIQGFLQETAPGCLAE